MKRLIPIFLALALALTGCESVVPTWTAPTLPETSAAEPTGTAAQPDQTEPTAPTGIHVHTDPSAYAPQERPEAKYTRLREGPLDSFIPSDDYGTVYPYAAQPLYTEYGGVSYRYGFFDASGRILTDGLYMSVEPVTCYDAAGRESQLPLWEVQALGDVEMVQYGEGDETYAYPEGDVLRGVVAMDGSFATPCEFVSVKGYDGGFIGSRSYDEPDFVIFDMQGKPLLTHQELVDRPCDWCDVNWGDGLFLLCFGLDEGSEFWFVNEAGEKVLGPYAGALAFDDGLACVSEDGQHYGYIDKSGAWVISPAYESCAGFIGDWVVQTQEGRDVVIDRQGQILLQAPTDGFIAWDDWGWYTYANGEQRWYDWTGDTVFRGSESWQRLSPRVFSSNDDDDLVLHNIDNAKELRFPEAYFAFPGKALIGDRPEQGYLVLQPGEEYMDFVTEDFSETRRLGYRMFYGMEEGIPSSQMRDERTGECFEVFPGDGSWLLFDEQDRRVGTAPKQTETAVRIIDGRILQVGTYACSCCDFDGELLFCYPLPTYLDD